MHNEGVFYFIFGILCVPMVWLTGDVGAITEPATIMWLTDSIPLSLD
jgi:hypothetical protein